MYLCIYVCTCVRIRATMDRTSAQARVAEVDASLTITMRITSRGVVRASIGLEKYGWTDGWMSGWMDGWVSE